MHTAYAGHAVRNIRTIPHSSTADWYIGVPQPIWYDVTAGTFLAEYTNNIPVGNVVVNAIPADEIHIQAATSSSLSIGIVAGFIDADNYLDFTVRYQSDEDSQERWLREFASDSFAADAFPVITQQPPVPFPTLTLLTRTFYPINFRSTTWIKLELAQTRQGSRQVLGEKIIPSNQINLVLHTRLSVVRQGFGDARVIACATFAADYGIAIDASGGVSQSFFIEHLLPSDQCGDFCGRIA